MLLFLGKTEILKASTTPGVGQDLRVAGLPNSWDQHISVLIL